MELGTISQWASVVMTLGLAMYMYYQNTQRATKDDIKDQGEKFEAAIKDHADRLTVLETRTEQLPSKEDFHKLEIAFTEIKGDVKAVVAIAGRLHDWLLEASAKGVDK